MAQIQSFHNLKNLLEMKTDGGFTACYLYYYI